MLIMAKQEIILANYLICIARCGMNHAIYQATVDYFYK